MGIMDSLVKSAVIKVAGKAAEGVVYATGKAIIDVHEQTQKSRISVPKSSNQYIGRNYEEVKDELTAYGFQSFGLVAKKDITKGWFAKHGEVAEITIGGKNDFKAKASFSPDAHVVIVYHTYRDSR